MTEEEAQRWIEGRFGANGLRAMRCLADRIAAENEAQNLIARTTMSTLWSRHIVDSAQLIDLAADVPGNWLDVGTGGGFPGLVVAALTERSVVLAEPRRRRADFLISCIQMLDISHRVTVVAAAVEKFSGAQFNVISARAVAALPVIFSAADHCSTWNTIWLLPKGRHAVEEIATAEKAWHGMFHVEQSLTEAESMIVVATRVRRR